MVFSIRFDCAPFALCGALTVVATLACLTHAHARRPLATDDAGIVDHGACQLDFRLAASRPRW